MELNVRKVTLGDLIAEHAALMASAPARAPSTALREFAWALLLLLTLQPTYLGALIATDLIAPASRRIEVMAPSMKLLADTAGDTTTECTALGVGLNPDASPLQNAILATRPINGSSACSGLRAAVEGQPDIEWLPYARYWHGYRVVLDPLTAVFRITDSRYVILLALVASIAWFGCELKNTVGEQAALAFLFPTLILTDLWRMFQVTSHALATAFIFAGAAWIARRARNGETMIVAAAALGSLFNFIDFLTNPPWQPMLIAFVILISKRGWTKVFQALCAWTIGYAFTWVSKWVLAVAWGAPWRDISDAVSFRLNGDFERQISHHLLAPSLKVLPYLERDLVWQTPAVVILIILVPLLIPRAPMNWQTAISLSLPALIPFAWFELLSNHTQAHPWTVYRPVASSIGIVFAAWIISKRPARDRHLTLLPRDAPS